MLPFFFCPIVAEKLNEDCPKDARKRVQDIHSEMFTKSVAVRLVTLQSISQPWPIEPIEPIDFS